MFVSANFLNWMRKTLVMAVGFLMLVPVGWAASPLMGQELVIIGATNAVRVEQGLSSLAVDARLMASAQRKAEDMAAQNYFSHASPEGHKMAHWINGTGYSYTLAGENLAKGFSSVDRLLAAWSNSPLHYKNLVEPRFVHIGVGVAEGTLDGLPATFVVQHFAEPTVADVAVVADVVPSTGGLRVKDAPMPKVGLRIIDPMQAELPITIAAAEEPADMQDVIDYWMSWVMAVLLMVEIGVLVIMSFRKPTSGTFLDK